MDSAAKAAALTELSAGEAREIDVAKDGNVWEGSAMKTPQPHGIKIPIIVFTLQAALLIGAGLIFLVLRPHW